jgi:hypothetical protein
MKKLLLLSLFTIIVLQTDAFAQNGGPLKIKFTEGDHFNVKVTEILYIRQQSSQVDSENVDPSWRTTVYNFTEAIEKVNPDGSAQVASTLDSFTTRIVVRENIDRNEYFRFNSTNEFDIQNRLRDIRALPRAQFLGQTIRYKVGTDGLVKSFDNLSSFQQNTIARSFDYDMLHAMMSLSDSLRVGQLLEEGFGVVAAFSAGNNGKVSTPYTMTEIPVTRNLNAVKKGDKITFTGEFTNAPDSTQYLEGIAFPMNLQHFVGKSKGEIEFKNGIALNGSALDTASLELHIESDVIKEQVSRNTTFERDPIEILRGRDIQIKELKSHHTPPKTPRYDDDPNMKLIQPPNSQDSTFKH